MESVHPHIRGDIHLFPRDEVALAGSPPHTWGHCVVRGVPGPGDRFTPTYVGTFLDTLGIGTTHAVHPHIRGDISNKKRERN